MENAINKKGMIKNGVWHVHTKSQHDAEISLEKLCEKAASMGAKFVTLTDHGTMLNVFAFLNTAKQYGLKAVPGVEAYVSVPNARRRTHMVLVAQDTVGLRAIFRAVSDSQNYIDSKGFPLMDMELLSRHFGEGTEGHGHVIASSACSAGVLCSILQFNKELLAENEKIFSSCLRSVLKKDSIKAESMEMLEQKYTAKMTAMQEKKQALTSEISVITDEIKEITKRIKRVEKYSKEVRDLNAELNAYPDNPKKQKRLSKLMYELGEDLENGEYLIKTLKEKESIKITLDAEKDKIDKSLKFVLSIRETISKKKAEYDVNLLKILPNELLKAYTVNTAIQLQTIFGKGNFFIELQNHHFPDEKSYMPLLVEIAREQHIPLIAGQDVHILNNSEEEVMARQIMRSLRFEKAMYQAPEIWDREMYLKSDDEMTDILSEIYPKDAVKEAMDNLSIIAEKCDVQWKKEAHYPNYHNGNTNLNAADKLKELAYKGKVKLFDRQNIPWTEVYQKRLDYELSVIISMGYADYHLIVQQLINIGNKMGHLEPERFAYLQKQIDKMTAADIEKYVENSNYPGYTTGPGRGSAAGSLVCYLLGITKVDPLKYNLLFERFLNVERVSMPDIDSDYAPSIRKMVITYTQKWFGHDAVCGISTMDTRAAKAALSDSGNVYASKMGVANCYKQVDQIKKVYDELEKKSSSKITLVKVKEDLLERFKHDEDCCNIIKYAASIEGSFRSIGMHAAGIIISDCDTLSSYVPLLYDKKNNILKAQCNMVEAEMDAGSLKMDFLGLNTLDILDEAVKNIYERTGNLIELDQLPFEQDVFTDIFAAGNTNDVFQCESEGMKQMFKAFKPDSIEDIILMVAAYRPGPLQYLDKIIAVKNKKLPETYNISELREILHVTYGYTIYQEQVQQIFQKLAGYSLGQADLVRRAMSKKKEKVLEAERKDFIYGNVNRGIKGCVPNGIDAEKADALFSEIMDFAKYCFNKSHAAAYALVSYQTAWLKYHYPMEFYAAVLNHPANKDVADLLSHVPENVKLLPPDINLSGSDCIIETDSETGLNAIRLGFKVIKGAGNIGDVIAEIRGTGFFSSMYDFLIRTRISNVKMLEKIIKVGGMDCFCKNRFSLKEMLDWLLVISKNIKVTKQAEDKLLKETDLSAEKKEALLEKIAYAKKESESRKYVYLPNDKFKAMQESYELLGCYLDGHPLDSFSKRPDDTSIQCMHEGNNYSVLAVVDSLRVVKTKKDNKNMAFMRITDKTGSLFAVCFPGTYSLLDVSLSESGVYRIYGKYIEKDGEKQFVISQVQKADSKTEYICIKCPTIFEWINIRDSLAACYDPNGFEVKVFFDGGFTGGFSFFRDIEGNPIRISAHLIELVKDGFMSEFISKIFVSE